MKRIWRRGLREGESSARGAPALVLTCRCRPDAGTFALSRFLQTSRSPLFCLRCACEVSGTHRPWELHNTMACRFSWIAAPARCAAVRSVGRSERRRLRRLRQVALAHFNPPKTNNILTSDTLRAACRVVSLAGPGEEPRHRGGPGHQLRGLHRDGVCDRQRARGRRQRSSQVRSFQTSSGPSTPLLLGGLCFLAASPEDQLPSPPLMEPLLMLDFSVSPPGGWCLTSWWGERRRKRPRRRSGRRGRRRPSPGCCATPGPSRRAWRGRRRTPSSRRTGTTKRWGAQDVGPYNVLST